MYNNNPNRKCLELELNFDCEEYHNIISWQSIDVTEPSATRPSLILMKSPKVYR